MTQEFTVESKDAAPSAPLDQTAATKDYNVISGPTAPDITNIPAQEIAPPPPVARDILYLYPHEQLPENRPVAEEPLCECDQKNSQTGNSFSSTPESREAALAKARAESAAWHAAKEAKRLEQEQQLAKEREEAAAWRREQFATYLFNQSMAAMQGLLNPNRSTSIFEYLPPPQRFFR